MDNKATAIWAADIGLLQYWITQTLTTQTDYSSHLYYSKLNQRCCFHVFFSSTTYLSAARQMVPQVSAMSSTSIATLPWKIIWFASRIKCNIPQPTANSSGFMEISSREHPHSPISEGTKCKKKHWTFEFFCNFLLFLKKVLFFKTNTLNTLNSLGAWKNQSSVLR